VDILLTNDDGINADGLRALIERAVGLEGAQVLVVAPDRERSASGHAISIHQPIEVRELPSHHENLRVYSASGTPADCVKLAVDGLLGRLPDLVISGVNRGPNLGTDVFYSGTVSAALEGALLGSKAIAVSVTAFENVDYTFPAELTISLAAHVVKEEDWPCLLNVNVPAVPPEAILGIAITRLGIHNHRDVFQRRLDPRGRCWFWLGGAAIRGQGLDDTDICAIERNLVSVTPLLKDLTDFSGISTLAKKSEKLLDIHGRS